MKTKLSLITLFACAVAGTTLLADNEIYDNQTIEGTFVGLDLANSSWVNATIGSSGTSVNFWGADLTGADFSDANIVYANFSSSNTDGTTILKDTVFAGATIGSSDWFVNFLGADLTGADFSDANIVDANFWGADLTGADFSDANIVDADFSSSNAFDTMILKDTVFAGATIGSSYWFVDFRGADLTGADFSDADIVWASFGGADLTGADFSDANIVWAGFSSSNTDGTTILKDTVFAGATIGFSDRFVSFRGADLTGADFSDANIVYADFSSSNTDGTTILKDTVFAGATIGASDRFVDFRGADLTGADFSDANIVYASFGGADLTRADFRGSTVTIEFSNAGTIKNTLLSDGKIEGFSMSSSGDSFTIKKHIPKEGAESVSAKVYTDASISGGATLTMAENSVLEVIGGKTLTIGDSGSLVLGENAELHFAVANSSVSSVSVADNGNITLSETAKLIIDYAGSFDGVTSFSVITWTDAASVSGLDSLIKGSNISLLVDGVAYDSELWNFSTENDALTIFGVDNKTIIIKELEQIVTLKTEEYVGIFDSSLTDYKGAISGSGNVYSEYTVNFGADVSAHTGTTYIDGGKFTIVDAATLGSGEFIVAEAATFAVSGTRTFENTLSGAGTFETTGTVTLNGDLSAHTGTTNVASGALTISENAKLGTGDFDVSGTLALSGNRTFANATRGDGKIEISSGATSFTTDIGTKTISVAQGASAALNDGVDLTNANAEAEIAGTLTLNGNRDFSATLSGAGKLATNGNVNFTSAASAFAGTTEISSGTFTVSESATLGTGEFDIAGTLALNGDRTFANATGGDGKIEVSSGTTTFATDIGTKTLSIAQGASAALNDGVDLTNANAEAEIAGTLNLNGNRDFSATLSGAGKLATNGTVNFGSDTSAFSGEISVESGTFVVAQGTTLNVSGALSVSSGAILKLFGGDMATVAVAADDGASIVFAEGAKLVVDVTTQDRVGFITTVMGWTSETSVSGLSGSIQNSNISLVLNGSVLDTDEWGYRLGETGLTVYTLGGTVVISETYQEEVLDRGINAMFDPDLAEYRGKISANGEVHSTGTLVFAADSSEHTGTMYVDSGSFTITDVAQLGNGDYVIAGAGTLCIEGTRDFDKTISGAGSFATSGAITFSGDASAHTGTTKVEDGTLTIAQSAKLGSGDFDVAGTLILVGDRTFENATSGAGKLDVASGNLTFTKNVGTATLDISSGASATFAGTSDRFAGTLTGAGSLTTTQNFVWDGDASGFSGKTFVSAGTFTVSETATLGTGTFDIAGTLALNGEHSVENAFIGSGVIETAGTILLGGDLSAHTGMINVKSGALTLADSVTLGSGDFAVEGTLVVSENAKLGTGDFDVVGTLALSGNRTFANTTSGDGKIEISSGSTTFATDVGTKTFFVSQGASATLNDGVNLTHENAEAEIAGKLALNGNRDFNAKLSGSGTLSTNGDVSFTSDASAFAGTTDVASGTFTITESATLGSGAFDVSGTLALTGERTFANTTSGTGTLNVASGGLTFTKNVGTATFEISSGASATFAGASDGFAGALTGAGSLTTTQDFDLSGDASGFRGKTSVTAGTFTVSETATLGAGTFDVSGTLALNGDRTFTNATGGDGKIEISSGATTFATDIGSKTLSVAQGASATLNDGVDLTHANAEAQIAGALNLNGDRDFSTTLSGAGKLATRGTVNFSSDTNAFSGEISVESGTFVVAQGTTLNISGSLSVSDGATMKLFGGDGIAADVVADSGASIEFVDGAKLLIDVTTQNQVGFITTVMGWDLDSSVSGLDLFEKNVDISFVVNGATLSSDAWNYTISDHGLTVYTLGGTITITEREQVVVLDRGINAMFDPNLGEYVGKISGTGELHSTGIIDFGADASTHTGTTFVDAGIFTIVDAAQLGSGDYVIAGAGTLRIEGTRDFDKTISGAGTFATSGTITFSGDASAHTGTTKVESGTLTIAQGALLGTGAFDVAGTLILIGDRTFENVTSGTGTLDVASGNLTFTKNVGTAVLDISSGASATFAGTSDEFSGKLTGAGSLTTTQDFELSGDASGFRGKTSVTAGMFTVSETATLGAGTFDVSGTLALNGDRTFTNATGGDGKIEVSSGATTFATDIGTKTLSVSQGASATLSAGVDLTRADAEAQVAGTLNLLGTRTFSAKTSGNGKISLASGSDVSFAKAVGVKTLAVENGAMLRGSVSVTHGTDAKISLAGTLVLNPDKGEKVSLGGGRVEIASSAKLDLVGSNSPFVRATSAQIEALENGERVTIFEGGAVSGNVLAFLRTDADLSAYAQNYAVIYDESNGGLSVRVEKNASALMDGMDTSELSASFVDWALSDANDALNSLSTGFVSAAAWNNLSGGNDPLLNAILAKDAGTARAILDRLSPKSYAAMIAMPIEAFNADARSISARLEQRRYDRFSKRAQWEFFAQLQTNFVENDTATDAPTFDFDTTGLLAGADYKLDQNTVLGVALGASTGEAKVHNGGGKIESTDFRITGFAGKTFEKSFVNAGAQLGYASYDIKRNTDYGNASGDTTGWSAGLFADAGTVVTLSEAKKIYATPYIGLAYMHTQADAFTESGSDKAFDADVISGDSLRARVGCGFSWGFTASGAIWRLGLDVAFSHDFLGDEVDVDVTTQDGSSITETAKALPEDMFSIGPSFNVDVSSSASVYGGYSFNAGTDASVNHSANVGFRMRF